MKFFNMEEGSMIRIIEAGEITTLTIMELTDDIFTFTFMSDDEVMTAYYVAK